MGLAIVSISQVRQGTTLLKSNKLVEPDKNGKMPYVLTPVAGTIPNRNFISGTVAENLGLVDGKSYAISYREVEKDDTYGRRFVWTKIGEASILDVFQAQALVGAGNVFMVDAAEGTGADTGVGKDSIVKRS